MALDHAKLGQVPGRKGVFEWLQAVTGSGRGGEEQGQREAAGCSA